MNKLVILSALAVAASAAAQDTFPLPASAASGSTNSTENTAPFLAPLRFRQTLVTNRNTLNTQGLPATFSLWDMSAFDPSGRYIFTPSENPNGCGVFRYDTQTGNMVVLFAGNTALPRSNDPTTWSVNNDNYGRFDPCTYTPFGTLLLGEETTGGRLFEVLNPMSNGPFQVRWLTSVPSMSHEGVRFDANGNLYTVDEDNSGCVYKFVPTVAGDLSAGQSFVLSVDGYAADPNAAPNENWNSTANRLTTRTGAAHWVALTDAAGNPLTTTNPFQYATVNAGRMAADEVIGTPFGRPEDMDFNVLASGNECIYFAATSENTVYSIELTGGDTAVVRTFVNFDTINLATGTDVNPAQNDPYTSPGSGTVFASPDNVSADAFGNIYVIEDGEPNGGDIWKCIDADKDGVAEAMGIFVSLGISGSEPTGMIWDPANPYRFIVNVQHPASGNDATWAFETRPYPGSDLDLTLSTGVNAMPRTGPGEFVKSAYSQDVVNINVNSENNTYTGRPFAVLLQAFGTSSGTVPFLPPLWMSPYFPIIAFVGGPAGQFTAVLPYGGSNTAVQVPSFLSGISVMTQGIVVAQNGSLVLTDGHEVVLR
ncbi:MAG: DUF839 domain-containing protein [Planctomycetes bacterium]|nr:DUF839 domain-containing protein [Planctomycetota bacterium]MCB9884091.1 DUF839 domain-containing protein [Planctomycetota bacterium]